MTKNGENGQQEDSQPVNTTQTDGGEEVKCITDRKEAKRGPPVEPGQKLDNASDRPTSFESLQTYIDSMSAPASPTPSVDSATSKETHSKKSRLKGSTFQGSFMTYLGSEKPKQDTKKSSGSCSSSECGEMKSCSSSVCDGDLSQKSKIQRSQKAQASEPFTWDVDSGDERIDLFVGHVVMETTDAHGKVTVCSEKAGSESSHSSKSSSDKTAHTHNQSKSNVRRIYHDGKIWEIGHGSVTSVSIVQAESDVGGKVSPVSVASDCSDRAVGGSCATVGIASESGDHSHQPPFPKSDHHLSKGDNHLSKTDHKPDQHHLGKGKVEHTSIEMIRVGRKLDAAGYARLSKSETDKYDKNNTYTSVTLEDMKNAESNKKIAKWKVRTEKRTRCSNTKEFPFIFTKNRRT